jgi:hypothetical protein
VLGLGSSTLSVLDVGLGLGLELGLDLSSMLGFKYRVWG